MNEDVILDGGSSIGNAFNSILTFYETFCFLFGNKIKYLGVGKIKQTDLVDFCIIFGQFYCVLVGNEMALTDYNFGILEWSSPF